MADLLEDYSFNSFDVSDDESTTNLSVGKSDRYESSFVGNSSMLEESIDDESMPEITTGSGKKDNRNATPGGTGQYVDAAAENLAERERGKEVLDSLFLSQDGNNIDGESNQRNLAALSAPASQKKPKLSLSLGRREEEKLSSLPAQTPSKTSSIGTTESSPVSTSIESPSANGVITFDTISTPENNDSKNQSRLLCSPSPTPPAPQVNDILPVPSNLTTYDKLEKLGVRAATPVRSRLENLSSRLAETARLQAVEKKSKQIAMANTLKKVEEEFAKISNTVENLVQTVADGVGKKRIQDLEKLVETLEDQLREEKRARISVEDRLRLETESVRNDFNQYKRDIERTIDDKLVKITSKLEELEKKTESSSFADEAELQGLLGHMSEKIIALEQHEVGITEHISELKLSSIKEKAVKEQMENSLMKMLEDMFGRQSALIEEEKRNREVTEEAILKILEDTVSRVELLE